MMKKITRISPIMRLLQTNRLLQITIAIIVVIHLMAFLMLLTEHRTNGQQFGNFGDAVWWAIVTVATVGYGDLVPTTPSSRLFAAFMVLLGYALMSLVTGAIAAAFVGEDEKRLRRELHEDIKRLRNEVELLRAALQGKAETPPEGDASI
jgi:voltage-gated potassium channel